ncbi:NAD dependent epimerase/dehydratase family protein [Thalassovita gelatinovora]|uniref:NAD dependent epimerase/dehydratase family protein n=1 Tax=Thalassovita gelatinovora TaxID=53501 RepID=A0A0P1FUN4_THAGE|nr:NAD(P)-dependent oxidoreductase [Thalassovita gelatinovora]QIZ81142.1 NAD(P)-dependent oxidoreductase [Thalassovita gelatinovora]CUH64824.1 NAD dependent epimerase/dehydratase family protein [Thalassovita gelatinovora]SEP91430.1 Nucleoside-diphosphate-sugar epimerase [Thalassovita gelatinovora]
MTGQRTKTLLVLGASGKVGRLLHAIWSAHPPSGLRVLYQFRNATSDDADCVQFSLGDPVGRIGPVDAVLSLWGVTSGDNNTLAMNSELANEAMRIARATGADRVLHSSSIAVYAPSDRPLNETDPVAAPNAYGVAKSAMENAVRSVTGPRSCALRIGSVAGAESLATSVDAYLAASAKAPLSLHRFRSGHGPARSYIAPSDLAQVVEALTLCPIGDLPGILNVGSAKPVTMDALLTAADIPFDWQPAPIGAREYAVLNTDRLHDLVPLPKADSDPARITRDWLKWRALS